MKASLHVCLLLLCWLATSEAGFFDKVGDVAKDVHGRVHEGAKKVGDFFRPNQVASTTTKPSATAIPSTTTSSVISASTEAANQSVNETTTLMPRGIIGSVKRCPPNEVYAAGDCRAAE